MHGFVHFFLATFALAIIFNLVMVLHRYKRRGKLCSRTNCVFSWIVAVIFVCSLGLGSKIQTKRQLIENDLNKSCKDNLQGSGLDAHTLLAQFDDVSLRA